MFSGKHKSCNYSKLLMKHPGGKRALVRGPLPQIQTKTVCNTFQNEDDEVPCYFNRTNQDAYFHPAYQDGRDPCWKWRNKALCNEKKKKIGEENSSLLKKIQCSALCQRINFLNVKHYWFWFCCSYLREKSFS